MPSPHCTCPFRVRVLRPSAAQHAAPRYPRDDARGRAYHRDQRAGRSALARSRDRPPSLPPSRVATASRRAGPDVGPPSRKTAADGAPALLNCKTHRRDGRPCVLGCWRALVRRGPAGILAAFPPGSANDRQLTTFATGPGAGCGLDPKKDRAARQRPRVGASACAPKLVRQDGTGPKTQKP